MTKGGHASLTTSISAYGLAVLVFAGHLAVGANRTNLSLGFSALWFAVLAVLLVSDSGARHRLNAARLRSIGVLFGLLVLLAVFSLTRFGVGGPHPIWSYAPGAPATVTIDPYATRVEIVKLLAFGAVFIVGYLFGADDDRAKALIRALLWVGLLFSIWAFFDSIANTNVLSTLGMANSARLSGAFGSPNTAATLFGSLVLLNIVDAVRIYQRGRSSKRSHAREIQRLLPRLARPFLGLVLAATCLILTMSRAGMAATFAVAVVMAGALAMDRARKGAVSIPALATALMVIGVLIATAALNLGALGQRFTGVSQDSLIRAQIFAAHWAAFRSAVWSGFGLGTFSHINAQIMNPSNLAALDGIGATHNVYIQWLEEIGVPGAVLMFALMAAITYALLIGMIRRRRMRKWLLAILAILALFAIHGASDYALQTPSMAIFLSLLLGLGVGARGISGA